ncbi:MAG: hypothetical protein OEM28_08565 [Nitrosopumilus sp.]|nr:hypothetical protein [Nitrosopumilus sp.]MDH3487902.1 hypothetical protein [Nitrosopumilus sp.]
MITNSSKKGNEIEEHLNSINMDPWFYIYENYIKDEPKEKLDQTKKEENSSD